MAILSTKLGKRRGGVSVFLLLALGVFLAALALSVDVSHLWQTRVEANNAADAAALAAAAALVDDDLLTGRPDVMDELINRARQIAVAFGRSNPVQGTPLLLDPNNDNAADGDIVFGYYAPVDGQGFQRAEDAASPYVNAVRITAQRTRARGNPAGMYFGRFFNLSQADVVVSATAIIDREVYGFRPTDRAPLPLMPIAIRSDPKGLEPSSSESQVLTQLGQPQSLQDRWLFDRQNKRFLSVPGEAPQGDGIPEMELKLPLAGQITGLEKANGSLLQIGDADWSVLCRQIDNGIAARDLTELGGQFALDHDGRLLLAGGSLLPSPDSAALTELLQALQTLRQSGEPRIWPLFTQILHADPEGRGVVQIQGFVAARLVRVQLTADAHGQLHGLFLSMILQPCEMATSTALTDATGRYVQPDVNLHNPYICKVRLVQ
jgi:Flp pilus assembly protein TadG